MTNGEKMKLNHSGNVFTIINVVRNDSGFYICQATNDAGYINTTFFVNVQCMYTLFLFSGCLQNNIPIIKRIVGASKSPVDTELWFAIIYNIIAVQHNNIFSMKSMVFEY